MSVNNISRKDATKAALLLAWLMIAVGARAQVSVTTYHNDNARTGQNLSETALTTANVNSTQFGRLFSQSVDGVVYSQPLYLPNVVIPGKGMHNVLYVTTEHNSVYAFDADNNLGANANPLWHINLGESVAVPNLYFGNRYGPYANIYPELGITGTPVIDPATMTIYVVAFTEDAVGGPYHHTLHALDATTGADVHTPTEIIGSVSGNGYDAVNGVVTFNTMQALQRSALLLSQGNVYIAFASHGDSDPYHGWIFAYDATTLEQVGMLNVSPNGNECGIWMTGNGPAADPAGGVWLSIGNGSFDADATLGGDGDYGDSVLGLPKLLTTLPPTYFTPSDQLRLAQGDEDFGSGGLTLIPDQSTGPTHLLVTAGKEGTIYVLDRDNMGGFNAASDTVVSKYFAALGEAMSSPAYWNGNIYYLTHGDVLKDFSLASGQLTLIGQSSLQFPDPGATPSISANGTQNGIVWALECDGQNQPTNSTILRAYDATNVANELYNTTQAGPRDDPGLAVKFAVPTVVNSKVYVPAQYQVSVYGLGPSQLVATPVITPSGGLVGQPISINDSTSGSSIRYTTDGSTPTRNSTLYTIPFTLANCATVTAKAFKVGALDSQVTSAFFGMQGTAGTGTGLTATYFSHQDLTGNEVVREDPTINFGWPNNQPDPTIGPNNWSARWQGKIQPEFTDTYSISTLSDDGIRVWVNGQEIINNWTDHAPTTDTGTISLVGGKKYPVTVEYYQNGGGATAVLSWSGECQSTQVVPSTQLYPLAPAVPTLSALPGNGKVALSWTATATATSYSVYRGTTSYGQSATPIASGIAATTYANTGLANGTTYYYRVAAFNAGGNSAESNQAAATPTAPPATPTALTATPANATVTLSWTAAAGATSYNVYRGTTSYGQSATPVAVAIHGTTYANTGLTNGVTYYYRVAAFNAAGNSPEGNQAVATPVVPPPAPTGLSATVVNGHVNLSWTASAGATSYSVYRGTTSYGESATPIASGNVATTYSDTSVTSGTTYYYRVAAFNAGGNSAEGNQAVATP